MGVCKFNTFENKVEMTHMIKNLQEKNYEYLKMRNLWDFSYSNHIMFNEN